MNRYEKLMRRVTAGERILMNGAVGTEVERRGVPQLDHAWNGGAQLTHPDLLRQVHLEHLRHGAEVLISNTFATTLHALRDAGCAERFDELNRRGVELAIEAREHAGVGDVLVAGGISYWSFTGNHPTFDALGNSVRQQAKTMAAAGADHLMLEMMVDHDRMLVCYDAAAASGLPVWVGLTCAPNKFGRMCLRNGYSLEDAIAALAERGAPALGVMHTEVAHIDHALDTVLAIWSGPIYVYAHSGHYHDGEWMFDGVIRPDEYAACAQRWMERGVNMVGGCCGIGPDHIERLRHLPAVADRRLASLDSH